MNGHEVVSRPIRSYSPKILVGSFNGRTKKPGELSLSSELSSNPSLKSVALSRTRSNSPSTMEKKLVTLKKEESHGLGFTLRGGVEHGLGHFISAVEQSSIAWKQGLRPGDQIVTIGGLSLVGATHKEVVALISSTKPDTSVSEKKQFNKI